MKVLLEIEVPKGKYCWNYIPPYEICEYFDNEGGFVSCDLGRGWKPIETVEGYEKPLECSCLSKVNAKEEK